MKEESEGRFKGKGLGIIPSMGFSVFMATTSEALMPASMRVC